MFLPRLDWNSAKPITLQLQEQIRNSLEGQAFRPGERLPSTRRLAELLGIHRSTVAHAYQELWAQGYLDQRPGSAPRVRIRVSPMSRTPEATPPGLDWSALLPEAMREACDTHRALEAGALSQACPPDDISFANLHMDPRLFPVQTFRASAARAMKRHGAALLGYGDRQGFRPLREYLARRMALHGVTTTPDEILVTQGAQQALDLMVRMLARPGAAVAVESPTYSLFLPLLRMKGLRPIEIRNGGDGLDLASLEQTLRHDRPVLVYTMPNFQNPTGRSSSRANREGLMALCARYGVPILEDGFDEEMKYFGRAIPPIKVLDDQGLVAYCGSFSKVLFAGLRVGWIVAPPACIEALCALRHFSEIAPSPILHAAIHEFCERGAYDLHVSRMHRVYRKRMQAALKALRQWIPATWAQWEEPNGGYLIWLRLHAPRGLSVDWEALFAAEGVRVSPGNLYSPQQTHADWVRLSISMLDEAEIEEGVRRLARALERLHHGG